MSSKQARHTFSRAESNLEHFLDNFFNCMCINDLCILHVNLVSSSIVHTLYMCNNNNLSAVHNNM